MQAFGQHFDQLGFDILVNVKLYHDTLIGTGIFLAPILLSKIFRDLAENLGKTKIPLLQYGITHPNLK